MSNRILTLAVLAIVALAAFGISRIGDGDDAGRPTDPVDTNAGEILASLSKVLPGFTVPAEPAAGGARAPAGPSYEIARVKPGARIEVRESPGGRLLTGVGAKTEFDSIRTFYIAKRRGEWLGVPSAARHDNRLSWIRDDPAQLDVTRSSFAVTADLSQQLVEVRWGRRVLKRIPVTVGRAGSETPPGLFAVTDGLAGRGVGPYYGCCVLALSGHQSSLPPGWIGGDRIAIHGTPGSVGGAGSAGCLRASNADMVALFALVPLGTPVFIRA